MALSGYGKIRKICHCDNQQVVTQAHIEECKVYDEAWDKHAMKFGLSKQDLIGELKFKDFDRLDLEKQVEKIQRFKVLSTNICSSIKNLNKF